MMKTLAEAKKASPGANRSVTPVRRPAAVKALEVKPPSLTLQAYERIEDMIVKLELLPGSAISESELSSRLGIGRTPVREALQRLAREHLVVILPQRGILVSEIDIKRQLRLLELRREVERLVVRCAARRSNEEERKRFEQLAKEFDTVAKSKDYGRFMRADKEFNDLSLRAARNEFAAGAMGQMHGLSRRFWFLHHRQADDTERMAKLHAELARAIAQRDEDGAAEALSRLMDHNEAFTKATVSTEF